MKKGNKVKFKIFYSDIEKGKKGTITKIMTGINNQEYARVYFGKNLGGQRLTRIVPISILELT